MKEWWVMCFQTKPTGFSKIEYLKHNKGFAGNTGFWKHGKFTINK